MNDGILISSIANGAKTFSWDLGIRTEVVRCVSLSHRRMHYPLLTKATLQSTSLFPLKEFRPFE